MEDIDPVYDRVSVNSLTFSRAPEAPDGAFRNFDASIEMTDPLTGVRSTIGHLRGRLGWAGWLPELIDIPELAGSVAAMMARAAVAICESVGTASDVPIDGVLMVDHLDLEPEWRGQGFGRRVAEQLVDLLLLTPESTLILAHYRSQPDNCQPQQASAPEEDPERIMRTELHRPCGFQPWGDGAVWWARMGSDSLTAEIPNGRTVSE